MLSIASFTSVPTTLPAAPTTWAASRATMPVPQATSSTRAPAWSAASATNSCEVAMNAGTIYRSYASGPEPVSCHPDCSPIVRSFLDAQRPCNPRAVAARRVHAGVRHLTLDYDYHYL